MTSTLATRETVTLQLEHVSGKEIARLIVDHTSVCSVLFMRSEQLPCGTMRLVVKLDLGELRRAVIKADVDRRHNHKEETP